MLSKKRRTRRAAERYFGLREKFTSRGWIDYSWLGEEEGGISIWATRPVKRPWDPGGIEQRFVYHSGRNPYLIREWEGSRTTREARFRVVDDALAVADRWRDEYLYLIFKGGKRFGAARVLISHVKEDLRISNKGDDYGRYRL